MILNYFTLLSGKFKRTVGPDPPSLKCICHYRLRTLFVTPSKSQNIEETQGCICIYTISGVTNQIEPLTLRYQCRGWKSDLKEGGSGSARSTVPPSRTENHNLPLFPILLLLLNSCSFIFFNFLIFFHFSLSIHPFYLTFIFYSILFIYHLPLLKQKMIKKRLTKLANDEA